MELVALTGLVGVTAAVVSFVVLTTLRNRRIKKTTAESHKRTEAHLQQARDLSDESSLRAAAKTKGIA